MALGVVVRLIVAARARRLTAAACAGILPVLRPDLAPTAMLVVLSLARECTWRERLYAVLIVAGLSTPWLAWMHHNAGSWVPTTLQAKRLFFAEGCQPHPPNWRRRPSG